MSEADKRDEHDIPLPDEDAAAAKEAKAMEIDDEPVIVSKPSTPGPSTPAKKEPVQSKLSLNPLSRKPPPAAAVSGEKRKEAPAPAPSPAEKKVKTEPKPKNKLITLEDDKNDKETAADAKELKKEADSVAAMKARLEKEKAELKAEKDALDKQRADLGKKTKKRQKSKNQFIDDEATEDKGSAGDDEATDDDLERQEKAADANFIDDEEDGTRVDANDDPDAPDDDDEEPKEGEAEETTEENAEKEETENHAKEAKETKKKTERMCTECGEVILKPIMKDKAPGARLWSHFHETKCWKAHMAKVVAGTAWTTTAADEKKGKGAKAKGKAAPKKPSAAEQKKAECAKVTDVLVKFKPSILFAMKHSFQHMTKLEKASELKETKAEFLKFVDDVQVIGKWGDDCKKDKDVVLDLKKLKMTKNYVHVWPLFWALLTEDGMPLCKELIKKFYA